MRSLSMSVALAAVFIFGFQANPASANCHAKLEAAQAKLDKVPGDYGKRKQIEKLLAKAEKFKDDKKKKKKCGNILKKANKQLNKAGQGSGGGGKKSAGGGDQCSALIAKLEDEAPSYEMIKPKYNRIQTTLTNARGLREKGKKKQCVKVINKTLKAIN